MPTDPRETAPASRGPEGAARLVTAAAGFAAAEILIGVTVGGFFAIGRAEALLFLALRPWLLVIAAALVSGLALRSRIVFYAAALPLAAIGESLFLIALGAEHPWPEAARGFAAGALLAAVADAAVQLGRRVLKRRGAGTAAALLAGLFLIPNALAPYEAVALERQDSPDGSKRDLMLMTALPLVWGEMGPLHPDSRPAAAYKVLEEEFRIRPLDVLDRPRLAGGALLLLAHPRALAPAELVALDDWVRGGGRALILTDPMLLWPSELPLGDIRRAPAIGLLEPLLTHWGLRMESPREAQTLMLHPKPGGEERRMLLFAAGRFAARSPACTLSLAGAVSDCRLGRGRAILLADADMMHDRLWAAPGPGGTERHARISDNPLILADLLDGLSGGVRPRGQGDVDWVEPGPDRMPALLLGLLPLVLAAAPGAWQRFRRRS